VIFAGLGVGLGLLGVVAGLRPVPRSAGMVLRSLHGQRRPVRVAPVGRRPDRMLGSWLAESLERRGWAPTTIVSSARAAQTSLETICAEAVLGVLCGLVAPLAATAVARVGGIRTPVVLPIWSALVLAVGGAALPFVVLRAAAVRARKSARTVVAAYLDLVVLCLAGGMGIEGALHAAAGIADDEFSVRIGASLERARDAGETPWEALSELGEELGVTELTELAAAVRLAGTEGARIRSTLSVKADSIRRHELAAAEAEANTVTERLFLPGVFLLVGFLLFVGYPAVARITAGT
jgi:Flp pilus assembly protein TadB